MCASASAGSPDGVVKGSPLDEQTQLELALFLSLQDQEQADAPATGTPSQASVSQAATSQWVASGQLSAAAVAAAAAVEADAAACEAADEAAAFEAQAQVAALEAEAAAIAAAAQAESAATTAAAQAESAAMAAAAEIESAAIMAAAQAESSATAAAAQAESAAATAAAQAAAAATTVAAHVEAAARSVDAALNTQAASVRGTVLSFADQLEGWWGIRQGQQPPRGSPADKGQAGVQDNSPPPSTQGPDSIQQEEAELAEAAEQVQSNRAEEPRAAVLSRIHSVASDDSSFDWTEAPSAAVPSAPPAASAPPVDQFAALSLLDMDSVVPDLEEDDSPFAVCEDVQGGMHHGSHDDEQVDDVGQEVPVIPWGAIAAEQALLDGTDEVPISYPQVHGSGFASSMGSESPIHYPQLHRPDPTSEDRCQPPSPKTQMHVTALGSDPFGIDSVMTDGAEESGAHGTGNAVSAEGLGESSLLQEEEEPASIHVQQGTPFGAFDIRHCHVSIHLHHTAYVTSATCCFVCGNCPS